MTVTALNALQPITADDATRQAAYKIQQNQALLAIAILTALTASETSAAPTLGEAGQAVGTLCAEAQFYAAVASELTAKAIAAAANLQDLGAEQTKLLLAASALKGTDKGLQYKALALYAKFRYETAAQTAASKLTRLTKAANSLSRYAGALTATETVTGTLTAPAAGTPAQTNGHKTHTTEFTVKAANQIACSNFKIDGKALDGANLELAKINQIKVSGTDLIKQAVSKATLTMTWHAANDAEISTAIATGTQAGGKITLGATSPAANDYILLALGTTKQQYSAPAPSNLGQETDNPRHCAQLSDDNDDTAIPDANYLHTTLCMAMATKETIPKIDTLSGKDLSADDNFLSIYAAVTGSSEAEADLSNAQAKQALEKRVKSSYKEENSAFKTAFFSNLDAMPIKYRDSGKAQDSTVGQLASDNKAFVAIGYFERPQTKATINSPEPDVKTDATEKKEQKKDGVNKTTTNTTGSNSFLINKVPLWLAFFLR
ncbi:uncharacterized protein TEOVI_000305600 [Trypanosoma equiperdum]|uniref:Variant surface glycoprotein (VSG) n=1 Tax=Trypanosoma equiperdum TaxID=5694 RepID=A0A1G4IGY3_TRYEQ|nr:hypothetical protein TEOVI_000305600 [Trypanosoma equiperdum]